MKNYDDLQRFKEKTATTSIDFKTFSDQQQNAEHSQWAIILQLAYHSSNPLVEDVKWVGLAEAQPISENDLNNSNFHNVPGSLPTALSAANTNMPLLSKDSAEATEPSSAFYHRLLQSIILPATAQVTDEEQIAKPVSKRQQQPIEALMDKKNHFQFNSLFRRKVENITPSPVIKTTSLKQLLERIASCH